MMAGDYASMRASDEDRWRVQAHLNEAFAEGRLTQQEWDERATALATARTYGDLDSLTDDLPAPSAGLRLARPQPAQPYAAQHTNGLARAGLIMGYVGLTLAVVGVLSCTLCTLCPLCRGPGSDSTRRPAPFPC
jgi:hypothetical protein